MVHRENSLINSSLLTKELIAFRSVYHFADVVAGVKKLKLVSKIHQSRFVQIAVDSARISSAKIVIEMLVKALN